MLSYPNIEVFDVEVMKYLRRFPEILEGTTTLAGQLSDASTLRRILLQQIDTTGIYIPSKKIEFLVGLATISWYLPEEIKVLLQLSLEELDWGDKFKEAKEFLLTSKEYCLAYLVLQEHWGNNDFWGNILNRYLARRASNLSWKYGLAHRSVQRKLRKRGHRESSHEFVSSYKIIAEEEMNDIHLQIKHNQEQVSKNLRRLQWESRIRRFLAS
jgi:hypothetical protein